MKQINYKKLILPNIPYVFFVYLFDKVGQAVRLAPGADISAKILNITQGFSAAFENALPSVYPLDLLVGIVGAVIIRLIVYVKGKNAKKYRRYGCCPLRPSMCPFRGSSGAPSPPFPSECTAFQRAFAAFPVPRPPSTPLRVWR